jgi:ABC-type transport system substrate-binding protein
LVRLAGALWGRRPRASEDRHPVTTGDPDDPARTTNGGGFCNATFDRLIGRAETLQLTNPAAAQNIWAEADHLAVDQAAWVPLANTGYAELLSRRAGHFALDTDGLPQIDQLWVH